MNFTTFDTWWWPYLFILVAGWLATDFWRFLGVYLGSRLAEDSQALVLVRCIATGLVAAVVSNLLFFPSGALAATPVLLRAGAAVAGFLIYLSAGKRVIVGIVAGELVLAVGMLF